MVDATFGVAPVAVVVPVKAFDLAKGRLAEALSATERARLAERMAAGVLQAAGELPSWVVCDSEEVASWATAHGAGVIWQRSPGLNGAIGDAVAFLDHQGVARVIIAHGDLPLATTLGWVGDFDGVTIVPDRRGEGTNVMAVPCGVGFRFAYGEDSARRHRAEAKRLSLPLRVVDDERLGWDVDTPEDLTAIPGAGLANDGTAAATNEREEQAPVPNASGSHQVGSDPVEPEGPKAPDGGKQR